MGRCPTSEPDEQVGIAEPPVTMDLEFRNCKEEPLRTAMRKAEELA